MTGSRRRRTATRRSGLYYLASNLDLTGTAVENWKLRVATVGVPVATPLLGGQPPVMIPPAPPGNHPIVILVPQSGSSFHTTSVGLAVRLDDQVNRNSFRAFLNGRDVTSKFARATNRACTTAACDLVATVSSLHGLQLGKNELKVEVRGPGAQINRDSRIFTVK